MMLVISVFPKTVGPPDMSDKFPKCPAEDRHLPVRMSDREFCTYCIKLTKNVWSCVLSVVNILVFTSCAKISTKVVIFNHFFLVLSEDRSTEIAMLAAMFCSILFFFNFLKFCLHRHTYSPSITDRSHSSLKCHLKDKTT